MTNDLPDEIRHMDDRKWLKMLKESIDTPVIKNIEFPLFPIESLQSTFVGSANETSLDEAFNFYRLVKEVSAKASTPLQADSKFLDFGCGWGRYLRFFWKDVNTANLYGYDVNKMIVDICHKLNVPGTIDTIDPLGQLPHEDQFFSHVMAYSVFTHLPEKVHLHWMKEIARVTRPGAIFCLTLEPRRFIEFIDSIQETPEHEWHRQLARHKPQLPEYYQQFDAGNLVFMPTNEGIEDTYGDAVVPISFIEKNWQPYFEVLDYIDNSKQFWQAVLTVRRTDITVTG